jgi:integrase
MLSFPWPFSLCHTPKLLSLSWEDVELHRRTITVHAAYAKNGESRRVPMNDVLTTTLKVVRMNTLADSLAFCSYKGIPYRSFRSAFELAGRKAGLENFTLHDLRHTFASRLVMAGVDFPTVKELMDHTDITMTLRYTHCSSDHKQCVVRMLERVREKVPAIFTTDRARNAAMLP